MNFPPAFLDEIRARTALSSVVGRRVKLTRAGREWKACCPFHNEKSPSFYVNDEKGFYHCFGCGAHGDVIRFLTDSVGMGFVDAVKELAQTAGLELPQQSPEARARADRAAGLHDITGKAAAWFTEQLQGMEGAEARAYLDRRGVDPACAKAFGLGYAPDNRGKLKSALKDLGIDKLVETGLLIAPEDDKAPYDRFRGRLIFPIRDPRGRVIGFGGRILGAGEPKYLNSPDTPLFDKGRSLYNLDRAAGPARKRERIVVVEGYMDVIGLARAGIEEAVAPLGTALTEAQLGLLWRVADVPLLCFDGDAAGTRAAVRAATRALPLLAPDKSLAFLTLPAGRDPDDLVREGGAAAFEALALQPEPLVDRLFRAEVEAGPADTPEQRAGLRARLMAHAETIADQSVAREYRSAFFERLDERFARRQRAAPAFKPWKPGARPGFGGPPPGPSASLRAINSKPPGDGVLAAILVGLIERPALIDTHHEPLGRIAVSDVRLARLRDSLIEAAVGDPDLDKSALQHTLASAGIGALAEDVRRANRLTFSFTRTVMTGTDRTAEEKAARDLAAVIDVLTARMEMDVALEAATARFRSTMDEGDFAEQQRLLAARGELDARLRTLARGEDYGDTPAPAAERR